MDNLNLKTLQQNTQLYKQIKRISHLKSLQRQLYGYQAILEYMNTYCLTQYLHIHLNNYCIINIIEQYSYYNDELCDLMLSINDDYNNWSEKGYDELDLELFLYDIQNTYRIIKSHYGHIIFDETLDFCQTYDQYIDFLETEEHCMMELKKFMNIQPYDYWYAYMETVAAISEIFNQYLNIPPIPLQQKYMNDILNLMETYYENQKIALSHHS